MISLGVAWGLRGGPFGPSRGCVLAPKTTQEGPGQPRECPQRAQTGSQESFQVVRKDSIPRAPGTISSGALVSALLNPSWALLGFPRGTKNGWGSLRQPQEGS